MNWLAHVYLSKPDVDFRLGNLLADLVKVRDRENFSEGFLAGTQCHQVIDAFTDTHPVVFRSKARIGESYRLFTGILVDIFYDHFLALNWERYSEESLSQFTARLYQDVRSISMTFPTEAQEALERMIADDRLGSYRTIEGMRETLERVSMRLSERLKREFDLTPAIAELQKNYEGLGEDFAEFFPQLRKHVEELGIDWGEFRKETN